MLDFFLRLTDEERLELINVCLKYDQVSGAWSGYSYKADELLVSAEEDRKDEKGERYASIRAVSYARGVPNYFASFRVYDFYMNYGEYLHDYNEVLRAFMTKKFGEEYIKALYARRKGEAALESKQLTEYLDVVRGNQDPARQ